MYFRHGGLGISDWRYNAILAEEIESLDLSGLFLTLGNDMVLSYFTKSCTPEQRARWLPLIAREEKILAVAMSEPEVGSDLGALSTRAVKSADGQHYIVNGRKMWISMGSNCDIMVCAVMTDPTKGYHGISLLAIERGTPGFACAKTVGKLGKAASDTCLMTLKDCKVPVANLIGHEGKGFIYMMDNLAKERLIIAVSAMAAARRSLSMTGLILKFPYFWLCSIW
jgi:alkylation response protein AidB-like acyl-CoA dehydrogenase